MAADKTRTKVVSRKILYGLNRKTSLSKGYSKHWKAKILVSRLLELSLRKLRCNFYPGSEPGFSFRLSFFFLFFSAFSHKSPSGLYTACVTNARFYFYGTQQKLSP